MAPALTTDSRTLERLLSGADIFRVPDYQRGYSWTIKEAGQLIDDLRIAAHEDERRGDPDSGYFLGAVLLMETAGNGGNGQAAAAGARTLDIVDGQQRLVTLTILLSVLRDLCRDRGAPIDELIRPMLEGSAAPGSPTVLRVSPRGREGAFLATYVQRPGACLEMPDEDGLAEGEARILAVREHLASELLDLESGELAAFARYLASACHFAVVTTRTIDRAHRIFSVLNERGRPLARNDILKAHILGAVPAGSRPRAAAAWDAMESELGSTFEELFSHVRTIEGRTRGTVIGSIAAIVEASGGAERFLDDLLAPYAAIFADIRKGAADGTARTPTIGRYLTYLGWVGSAEWVPPLILFWHRCGGDAGRLEAFLVRYDRLCFGLRLLGIGADKRLSRFNAVLQAIRDGREPQAVDNPLDLTREEQRNILYNLRGLHARSQLTCKLLLLRLNDLIAGTPQHLDPSLLTVEHVLPQKPGRNSQWRTWFPLADERETCTQSLGNLILVTREQNDRARNMELPRKIAVYFADPQAAPHISRDLKGVTEWRRDQIIAREQRLLALVNRLWQLDTGKVATGMSTRETERSAGAAPRRTERQAT
jgi:hypothetical protein